MYHISVNNAEKYVIDKRSSEETVINDITVKADICLISPSIWHIINNLRSYNIEVVSFDRALKTAQIRVNNNLYTVAAKDQFDILLADMGLNNVISHKIAELKAPMPGLVLRTFIKDGDEVLKGDTLFILEAMKMENIITAPADAIVKTVKINPGDKVDKGQTIILFS